jgi:hypothetical protein
VNTVMNLMGSVEPMNKLCSMELDNKPEGKRQLGRPKRR